jgi:hypothetical protein
LAGLGLTSTMPPGVANARAEEDFATGGIPVDWTQLGEGGLQA